MGNVNTVKPVLSGHSKRRPKLVFNTYYRLMQVKSIAECSNASLSYHLSLRSVFCLFLSGRLRQVLLFSLFEILKKIDPSLVFNSSIMEVQNKDICLSA